MTLCVILHLGGTPRASYPTGWSQFCILIGGGSKPPPYKTIFHYSFRRANNVRPYKVKLIFVRHAPIRDPSGVALKDDKLVKINRYLGYAWDNTLCHFAFRRYAVDARPYGVVAIFHLKGGIAAFLC